MTSEQMKEESRKATEVGLREVAEALAKKQAAAPASSDEESDSSSGHSRARGRRSGRGSRDSSKKDTALTDRLESRIRYLQLDVANAKVEIQDAQALYEGAKGRLDPYIKANHEFGFIQSAIDRSSKGLDDLTIKQFRTKMNLFTEEAKEHLGLCALAINKLDLHQVKAGLERVLAVERRRVAKRAEELNTTLWWLEKREVAAWSALITVAVLLIYWLLSWLFF